MDIINFELTRQSAERRRKEREERIKNGQICGTCKHWKLRIDKRVDNWDLPCAQNWGIIDPNDTCHCWKSNEDERMRDVTGYPLSPIQRKEVEEYMSNHNVTENEARYALGYVPLDLPQVSVTEALEMVKKENPDVELTKGTLKFYLDEVMKKCIPKPNPKLAMEILIKKVKTIVCPHCDYEIEMNGYSNALNVELIENKKLALMCPMCFTPFSLTK